MSDFVNEFWNWYVILIVLVSVVSCGIFLWFQSIHHSSSEQTTDTTGHVWDETLQEYNNPLPRWWMWLFYLTVLFALTYVALYPALGRFPGIWGWTSTGAHKMEVDKAEAQLKPLFDKYLKLDLATVAADKEAMEMGGRLFQTYCIQCHGATGQGSRDKGFPNLTDKDWQWGGAPEQIVETISNGRIGMMPPYGGNPDAVGGEAGAKELANYVRSLSGLKHDADLATKGETRFKAVCFACHGMDGKGQQALGAPNLTDKTWLYGSSETKIIETITQGRTNQMPAWKEFLGEGKVHLLAAYVLNLSSGGEKR
ncbi:cytochrome-c oxidase, cbb3-type subunit III [uncultured Propionivibrio sp.]|uniref:cytochrome-c oxidase, cbb3-type subunit III n=1 Tax=uncultured Propionivibrio sp. TaxID=426737 RepID=UPI0029C0FA29|nr:cytochrome-c oxidase, cbb3-type subunit III [uncultured Propionivibrio sp.]